MNDYDYTIKNDGTGFITDCHIEDLYTLTEIAFPAQIDGITITEIDTGFLKYNELLETVFIPNTITSLHHETTKEHCVTTYPIFPDCVSHIIVDKDNPQYYTLDDVLYSINPEFYYNTLVFYPRNKHDKNFTIPSNVNTISEHAFSGAKYLQYVTSDSVSEIESAAFSSCKALKEFSFPNIREIYPEAFSLCLSLKTIHLPETLEFLGNFAFSDCNSLKYVKIDSTEISLTPATFAYCHSVEKFDITDKNDRYITIDDVVYSRPNVQQLYITSKFNPVKWPFHNAYNLVLYPAAKKDKSYTLPENINCISDAAFGYLQNLEELYIPQHCEYTTKYFDERKLDIVKRYNPITDTTHAWRIIEENDDTSDIPYLNTDKVVIVSNKWECLRNGHHLLTKDKKIRLLDDDNYLHDIVIQVGLCLECNRYYIYSTIFKQLILNRLGAGCNIIGTQFRLPEGNTIGIHFQEYGNMRTESILKVCGYHVGNYSSLSKNERLRILRDIIDKQLLTKQEVLNYLNHFITVNGKRSADMSQAISEWEEDMLAL